MVLLIPVQYGRREYPFGIKPLIQELAGHFDVNCLRAEISYSLHTEYSYGAREFTAVSVRNLKTIQASNKNGIPMLWYNQHWAEEFCQFIRNITEDKPPAIIEIHPPFNDYCSSITEFLKIYREFEYNLLSVYPNTKIFIENRCGSLYKGGHFIFSPVDDLLNLTELIKRHSLKLRIALDIPQLFSAYGGLITLSDEHSHELFISVKLCSELIDGIHLWGKKRNDKGRWVSHVGDITTYCDGDTKLKDYFLGNIYDSLNDNIPRYIVLEVKSNNEDLCSITNDLIQSNFLFVEG